MTRKFNPRSIITPGKLRTVCVNALVVKTYTCTPKPAVFLCNEVKNGKIKTYKSNKKN